MCTPKAKESDMFSMVFTYQLVLVYLWVVFILTSTYDIEQFIVQGKLQEEFLLFIHIIAQMSKTVTKKKSKQKEIDPKFGVSEWDPAELDVRHTRHGTYESRPPPRGELGESKLRKKHITKAETKRSRFP